MLAVLMTRSAPSLPLRLPAGVARLSTLIPDALRPKYPGLSRFPTLGQKPGRNFDQLSRLGLSPGSIRTMTACHRSSHVAWITELKTGSEPKSYKGPIPVGIPKNAQHVLIAGEDFQEPKTIEERAKIAKLVKLDGTSHPPIDFVALEVTFLHEQGSVCLALDGLKPRGLLVSCGPLEEYSFNDLEKLNTPWPLEHLFVSGCIDPIPPIYESVTSLGLWYCCGVTFAPSWPFKALRELLIVENDAGSMFVDIALNHLKEPSSLKVVKLSCSIHDWYRTYEECDFVRALKACPAIETLEIVTPTELDGVGEDGQEHILTTAFPHTLKHLRFRGPPSMLDKMPAWIRLASDSNWLPNLETISFRLDADVPPGETPVLPTPIPAIDEFLITLKQSHPSLEIDQLWNKVSVE